jgi:hypothetical protein
MREECHPENIVNLCACVCIYICASVCLDVCACVCMRARCVVSFFIDIFCSLINATKYFRILNSIMYPCLLLLLLPCRGRHRRCTVTDVATGSASFSVALKRTI